MRMTEGQLTQPPHPSAGREPRLTVGCLGMKTQSRTDAREAQKGSRSEDGVGLSLERTLRDI